MAMIELDGICRRYQKARGETIHALRGVSMRIDRGEFVAIVGASGSGKSTLMNVLGLLDRPDAGMYRLNGREVSSLTVKEQAHLRNAKIGFVFQSFHLLAHRSVLENVALAMVYTGVPRRERGDRARAALERVGLGHRIEFSPATLSGGERQRVAIARALVGGPSLLLADEPTGNLDSVTAGSILDLFDSLHGQGLTLAVVTHDEAVSRRAQRRVRTVDGRVHELEAEAA